MAEDEMENEEERVPSSTELPFVLRGQPMEITAPGSDMNDNSIPEDDMPEDLSQDIPMTLPSRNRLPPPPTDEELQDMEEEAAQAQMEAEDEAADRMAAQQARAQEAAEKYADKQSQNADADALFGVDEEDVMGGSMDELEDDFTVDPEDFEVDSMDVMGGDAEDFSDILEVKQEDVLGKPPASISRRARRASRYSPPVNPQLGGLAR